MKEIFKIDGWWNMKYDGRRKIFKGLSKKEFAVAQEKAIRRRYFSVPYYEKSLLRRCYESVCEWAKPVNGSYQKVVMYGHTWLYMCSPVYGLSDYNKHRLMPIEGNEKECEFLLRVSIRVATS